MVSIRFKLITAVMLGLGLLALSTACIVPVYEYDGWGYRHRYYRGGRGHDECLSGTVVYREERR